MRRVERTGCIYLAFLQCPFSNLFSTVRFQDSDEDNGRSGENMRRVERSSPLWVSTLYGFDCQQSGSGNLVLPAYTAIQSPSYPGDVAESPEHCTQSRLLGYAEAHCWELKH